MASVVKISNDITVPCTSRNEETVLRRTLILAMFKLFREEFSFFRSE